MKAIAELQFIRAAKANGFARILLGWYDQHARKLPWREDRDLDCIRHDPRFRQLLREFEQKQ